MDLYLALCFLFVFPGPQLFVPYRARERVRSESLASLHLPSSFRPSRSLPLTGLSGRQPLRFALLTMRCDSECPKQSTTAFAASHAMPYGPVATPPAQRSHSHFGPESAALASLNFTPCPFSAALRDAAPSSNRLHVAMCSGLPVFLFRTYTFNPCQDLRRDLTWHLRHCVPTLGAILAVTPSLLLQTQ